MTEVALSCVIEGHGEREALPMLLRRIAGDVDPGVVLSIPHPIRVLKNKLLKAGELERYVDLAWRNVEAPGGVLVLIDADEDCAATLGPALVERAREARADAVVGVVLAVREFEAWFLASASSLAGVCDLPADLDDAENPEDVGGAKEWLSAQMGRGRKYSETVDQTRLAASFDMVRARQRSPSFDKCWREVERILLASRMPD
jgi:uncharacterized protein DUF4276